MLLAAGRERAKRRGLFPDLEGSALVLAVAAAIGVPVLVALFPRWLHRWTGPMLAVSAVGVYATVPDTEHVRPVMVLVVIGAILCFALGIELPALIAAAVALLIVGAAIADSAGRSAPIARAAASFAVLLAAPVAAWIASARERGRPPLAVVLVTHGALAVFASRALIRESSVTLVAGVLAAALAAAVALLVATSKP